jgi:hypothetical protein
LKNIIYVLSISYFFLSCSNPAKEIDPVVQQMKDGKYSDSTLSYQDYINQTYQVFSMPIPKNLTFAGDIIPLDKINVRENLDREILVNTYWHSNTFLYQKRSARWFPLIEKILAKNGVPDDLKYIALIESGLVNVVSPAGATGFWQFMKPTAEGYGLVINEYIDERYSIEKSTEAACKYLKSAHKEFGDWSLAAASYNMGKGGLQRQLKKQKVDNYYDLFLNKETSRYVYRILAAKLILSNSKKFGFNIRPSDYYAPYSTYSVEVDSSISDLAQFALDNNANYNVLRTLNPWMRGYSLPVEEDRIYSVKLPKGDFNLLLDTTNNTSNNDSSANLIKDTAQLKQDTAQ